ncbi:MAG: GNAT family N-acetyltransferase [Phycisphaerales bacterium]|nr:GNAT family N-acetyltransferase [Phycisphaerales bacterium]
MLDVTYGSSKQVAVQEIAEFYERVGHGAPLSPQCIESMLRSSDVCITARVNGDLIGFARGMVDGDRGYLAECKLVPDLQGPGAVTRTDGRIEHDTHGIATEMAQRVIDELRGRGVARIDVIAWGTEQDFLEELGFRTHGGLVGMTLSAAKPVPVKAMAGASAQ